MNALTPSVPNIVVGAARGLPARGMTECELRRSVVLRNNLTTRIELFSSASKRVSGFMGRGAFQMKRD